MPETTWKTVKAPKTLYLPVILGDKFDNTGMKVHPSDTIEIRPGSNQVRINGVEHRMMVSVDVLRVDDQGIIQLDKPKPPGRMHSGGEGFASVGRMGVAVARARQNTFTTEGPSRRSPGGATHARGFPIVSDETPAFGRPVRTATAHDFPEPEFHDPGFDQAVQGMFGAPEDIDFSEAEINEAFDDGKSEIREITLQDGSKAYARFDKKTGVQVGTPFRQYQARYDDNGVQQGVAIPTRGRNFDQAKYDRIMAEQMADAEPAPTGHDPAPQERYEKAVPKHASRTLHGAPPRPAPVERHPHDTPAPAPRYKGGQAPMIPKGAVYRCTTSGSPHLDTHITASRENYGGYPIGHLTWLQGPQASRRALLDAAKATETKSFASALGDMALMPKDSEPVLYLELGDLTDPEVRLALADDLPTLIEQVKGIDKAAFIISTPVPEKNVKLIDYMASLVLIAATHPENDQFTQVTLIKNEVNPRQTGSISFPTP